MTVDGPRNPIEPPGVVCARTKKVDHKQPTILAHPVLTCTPQDNLKLPVGKTNGPANPAEAISIQDKVKQPAPLKTETKVVPPNKPKSEDAEKRRAVGALPDTPRVQTMRQYKKEGNPPMEGK